MHRVVCCMHDSYEKTQTKDCSGKSAMNSRTTRNCSHPEQDCNLYDTPYATTQFNLSCLNVPAWCLDWHH